MTRRPVGPSPDLRVALLCSRRAPGLDALLEPGRPWRLVAAVTSDPAFREFLRLQAAGVPTILHDIRDYYGWLRARLGDLRYRPDYDRRTVELLAPFGPDLIVCASYLHILTEPFLAAYPGRVISVHDSDLTLLGADGRPKYRGLHSTRDAIRAGERETRSTVHRVTAEVDLGPPLVRSWAFPVSPFVIDEKPYANAHRRWMMDTAWGPLLARAIERFARGASQALEELPSPIPSAARAAAGGG